MNHTKLFIFQVALSDEGELKCTATNRAGHIVSRANLTVDGNYLLAFQDYN